MRRGCFVIVAFVSACARPTPSDRVPADVAAALQRIELSRAPSPEARSLLASPDAPVRVRAALAVGRVSDAAAVPALADLLSDLDAGEMAAWALGRVEGGREALVRCLAAACPAAGPAVRALSGPEALKQPATDALVAALSGPVAGLLPTPNAPLNAVLGQPRIPVPVPAEARAMPRARVLRLRTSRGEMVIDLHADVAPLTTSALAALASGRFYDGLSFHRVVPDFVAQAGDPRGDGDGGPGWALPDEHSALRFLRGTLGIATSGPETGGSQFFLCHSPQPHLDGRYTVAGQLRSGDDVLDALQPGDTILSATAE